MERPTPPSQPASRETGDSQDSVSPLAARVQALENEVVNLSNALNNQINMYNEHVKGLHINAR